MDEDLAKRAVRLLGLRREDFAVLGAAEVAALKERVRKAYRRVAPAFHPDRGGDPEVFVALGAVLLDIEKLEAAVEPEPRRGRWTFKMRARTVNGGGNHGRQ